MELVVYKSIAQNGNSGLWREWFDVDSVKDSLIKEKRYYEKTFERFESWLGDTVITPGIVDAYREDLLAVYKVTTMRKHMSSIRHLCRVLAEKDILTVSEEMRVAVLELKVNLLLATNTSDGEEPKYRKTYQVGSVGSLLGKIASIPCSDVGGLRDMAMMRILIETDLRVHHLQKMSLTHISGKELLFKTKGQPNFRRMLHTTISAETLHIIYQYVDAYNAESDIAIAADKPMFRSVARNNYGDILSASSINQIAKKYTGYAPQMLREVYLD